MGASRALRLSCAASTLDRHDLHHRSRTWPQTYCVLVTGVIQRYEQRFIRLRDACRHRRSHREGADRVTKTNRRNARAVDPNFNPDQRRYETWPRSASGYVENAHEDAPDDQLAERRDPRGPG